MNNPKVNVLMSVFNGERFLKESIGSILNQTFKDFEFIIINDGSTDSTPLILDEYEKKDKRVKVICQENRGLTKSLNTGLKLAKGKYIARMDADDISDSKRLETQARFLDSHPSIGVVGIVSHVMDEDGNIKRKIDHPISHGKIMEKILGDNKMTHSSLMLRKNLLETYGYYNEKFIFAQDYELLLRLSTVTKLVNLPEPSHLWRENFSTGISRAKRQSQIVDRDIIRREFLEKHYALNNNYINLVLKNFSNNFPDLILCEYLNKILKDISFISGLFIRFKFLYYLLKTNCHPKSLLNTLYRNFRV